MVEAVSIREPMNADIVQFLAAPSKRIRSVLAILYKGHAVKFCLINNWNFWLLWNLCIMPLLIHDDIIDESKV